MISSKKTPKKLIALIMAVLMLMSVIPAGMLTTAFASIPECLAIEISSVKVYFYGVDTLDVDGDTVTYTGGDETITSIYVDGSDEVDTTDLVIDDFSITFSEEWLSSQSGWIAVLCDSSIEIPIDEPTDVEIDNDNPTIALEDIAGNPAGWTNESVTITVTGKDATNDVVFYSMDKVNWQESNTFIIEENGDYIFYAKDRVGNESDGTPISVVFIDKEAPSIPTIEINPESWTAGNIEVKVSSTDTQSSVKYSMDKTDWIDTGIFEVAENGTYTFYVVDEAGNTSEYSAQITNKDVYDPEINNVIVKYENTVVADDEYISSNHKYTFSVDASDVGLGVVKYGASVGESTDIQWNETGEFELEGAEKYTFYAVDGADLEGVYTYEKGVDNDAPSVQVTLSTTEPTNQPIDFTVFSVDNRESSQLMFRIDGSEWQTENVFIIKDSQKHTFEVKDDTIPANVSEIKEVQAVNYFASQPTIKAVKPSNEDWTKENIDFIVEAECGKENAAGVQAAIVGYVIDPDLTVSDPVTAWQWQESNKFIISDCNEHSFYIIDEANNISEEAYIISAENYDNNAPTLKLMYDEDMDGFVEAPDAITFEQKNASWISSVLNKLSFGRFFNEELIITVKAQDVSDDISNASGIVSATFEFVDYDKTVYEFAAEEISNKETSVIEFKVTKDELPRDFKGTAKVILLDAAGNESEFTVTTHNSNMGDIPEDSQFSFMIENTAPIIDSVTPDATSVDGVYRKDYSVEYEFSDKTDGVNNSGLAMVKLEVNGTLVLLEDYTNSFTDTEAVTVTANAETQTVNNVKIDNWNNGELKYAITVADNAGNVSEDAVNIYCFDQTAPQITGFAFSKADDGYYKDENSFNITYEAVSVEEYGFYFKNTVNVTVSSKDVKNDKEAVATGVKSITVYLKDADNGKLYTVKSNGAPITEIKSLNEIASVETSDKLSFIVPQDFKGQIYAYATDNVGNSPKDCAYIIDNDVNADGFASPDGSIIETTENHTNTSAIEFTSVPKAQGVQNNAANYSYQGNAQQDKNMDYIKSVANSKVPLYNRDITFGVKVTDNYSGIRQVTYTIIEGPEKTVKTVQIDNNGSFSDNIDEGWKITKDKNDSNLVTEITNNIAVSGNYNDMVLLVELTDRAGNKSYDYYVFGIDKTAPSIEVAYDNNDGDSQSGTGTYFKADRTATITVTERNFNKDDVKFTIQNAEGDAPSVKFVKDIKGTGNADDTKHIFEVSYKDDGVYSFAVNYKDRAENGNSAVDYKNSLAPTSFVLDKTKPTIAVTYDNNSVQNSKYFNAYRAATIVVTEHNFDVNRVVITGTAALDGNSISFPSATWVNNGDTHTATINYNTDGDYTFSIAMDDKAGNVISDNNVVYGSSVSPKDFTVDTSITEPTIGGVENGKSYKDEVIPTILIDDVNYASSNVQLLRTRKDEINLDVTSRYITNVPGNRAAVSEDTFEKIQENDGIYTLNVSVTDLAGNTASDSVTFTVNRFGSVYVFSNDLVNLKDAYVQEVTGNIVITEYNPDRLVADSLKVQITLDGAPIGDVKYTVNPVVNDAAAIGSSGWYQYDYVFENTNFADDGVYTVTIASEDTAGNKPQSTNDSDLMFRVDSTPPEVVSVKGLENKIVNAADQKVEYQIMDAIGLKSIVVSVDNIAQEPITDFENVSNYSGAFTVPEGLEHSVKIVITDLAGNVTDTSSDAFKPTFEFNNVITVSTNGFIRWYADKPLFIGSIVGVAVAAGLIAFIIVKKKKNDDDTKPKA